MNTHNERVARIKTQILAVTLMVYVVLDILLTPPAHLETRPVAKVTALGFVTLGLLFAGLALAIVSLVVLFRNSRRTPIVAIVAAALVIPAVLTEQTGHFSAVQPPAAIETIELVQFVVALIVVAVSIWIIRGGKERTTTGR